MNSYKGSISIMFCGSSAGVLLPPYVVYKGERMFDTFAEGGPAGTHFNVSKSGWFDLSLFEDWFDKVFIQAAKALVGKKVLLADNLSSHVSLEVLRLCQKHDIHFIFLPPNSTHLLQPLDVAVFAPLKKAWRGILNNWRASNEGREEETISKSKFPALLKNLMLKVSEGVAENLISGFRKTGIFPFCKEVVLRLLPRESPGDSSVLEAFVDHLKELRYGDEPIRKRKRCLNVPPGKSVRPEDLLQEEPEPTSSSVAVTASSTPSHSLQQSDVSVGKFVLIDYEGELFPAEITSINRTEKCVNVKCMRKSKKHWRWPETPDEVHEYSIGDIVKFIRAPKVVNKQGIFRVKELEYLWG